MLPRRIEGVAITGLKPKNTRGDGKDGADKEGARNTRLDRRSVVDNGRSFKTPISDFPPFF
jgi:hypothetical protein